MAQVAAQVYQLDINAPPERVWQALVAPELTEQYYFGTRVESDWQLGSPVRYRNAKGAVDVDGELLEIIPPRRLVTTFRPTWAPDVARLTPSTVLWEITPRGGGSRVTLTHSGFDNASPVADMISQAWEPMLMELKKLLESSKASGRGG